jgi:hypothetical protein
MKSLFLILGAIAALCFTTTPAHALPKKMASGVNLPGQEVLERQAVDNPAAAGTADVLSAHAGATSAAVATASTFVAQPDVPRNLVITPGGTTGDVESCIVTVTGTNIRGQAITEDFSFLANASTATTGTKAFRTVTGVSWAANCESGSFGATWSIGYGEKIGLRACLDAAGYWGWSMLNGAKEATAATVVADADEIEKNTADFNGAMNGSNDFVALYIQNFSCP